MNSLRTIIRKTNLWCLVKLSLLPLLVLICPCYVSEEYNLVGKTIWRCCNEFERRTKSLVEFDATLRTIVVTIGAAHPLVKLESKLRIKNIVNGLETTLAYWISQDYLAICVYLVLSTP